MLRRQLAVCAAKSPGRVAKNDKNVGTMTRSSDEEHLRAALRASLAARTRSSPNPWVGCRIVAEDGTGVFEGTTSSPGGPHAEAVALARAGDAARGSTVYVTLEPCAHQGRTPPCVDALVGAGVHRVVVGALDPDPRVQGRGVARLAPRASK